MLFAEGDYAKTVEDTFAEETAAGVIVLDPVTGATMTDAEAVSGADGNDSREKTGVTLYCEIMRNNLECIRQAYGVR